MNSSFAVAKDKMKKKFNSIFTINKDRDFRRAYSRGNAFVFPYLVLYVNKNLKKGTRIGITASKKIGNAVKRNRARRIIKQAFLELVDRRTLGNLDFVFVARAKAPGAKSFDVKKCLTKLFVNMKMK